MRFELFVATRYLRAKRRQAFIGVITGISILGVAAGVASLIVALAVNNGFRQDLQARLLGSTAHISLLRVESDGIRDWRPLLEKLSKQPHVVAAAPAIYEQVLISRGPRARGAVLKGMLPQYERKVSDLLKTVTLGSAAALEETDAGAELRSAWTGGDARPHAGICLCGRGLVECRGRSERHRVQQIADLPLILRQHPFQHGPARPRTARNQDLLINRRSGSDDVGLL